MWGYQHDGVEPDAVIVGKGLSGGIYPITVTLLSRELHGFFLKEPFIHMPEALAPRVLRERGAAEGRAPPSGGRAEATRGEPIA